MTDQQPQHPHATKGPSRGSSGSSAPVLEPAGTTCVGEPVEMKVILAEAEFPITESELDLLSEYLRDTLAMIFSKETPQ